MIKAATKKNRVFINDKEVVVDEGKTILDAAKQIGVHIPTLCYHPDLSCAGICRICVVEVTGFRTLQAACSTPCADGMEIRT